LYETSKDKIYLGGRVLMAKNFVVFEVRSISKATLYKEKAQIP